MSIDFLTRIFADNEDRDAVVWKDKVYVYKWLLDRTHYWLERLKSEGIKPGTISILEADFSPNSIALFLALIGHACVVVPLTSIVEAKKNEFLKIAQGEVSFIVDKDDSVKIGRLARIANHELYQRLRSDKHGGLVCFTSGSTGESKAVVHDMMNVLEKYKIPRPALRTITFLPFDHFGGVNTMLHVLSNGGCIVTIPEYNPDTVLSLVERHKVELLPTSPTFINLMLLSEAYKRYNIDSLKIISYGTEPMLESTLRRFHALFPKIKLLQTYGLSEVGVLRSKSKSSDTLWVKVGGEGFQTRIVNGLLQIKARSAMLGYLNAPNPFTPDGWLNTEDRVEIYGDYIRILGRQSDIINVGGAKVFPQEVESVIREIDNIADVTVFGEKNPIMGNIICAKVRTEKSENLFELSKRVKRYCSKRLERFKVPVRIVIADEARYSNHFKKIRR